MKHHVPIDAPGRARPVASTANMYTLASVRLLSFWLTATCSSAVKAYTYAYHTCVKRSRVYTFIHSCGRGNGARATQRLVYVATQRLWARDVSSQAFPVFNVSLPRTIKRAHVTGRPGTEASILVAAYNAT